VPAAVGLLGKLPSHGDFLRRNLPAELAGPLDDWLAAVVAGSRENLGEGWRGAWLEAPVWRFALAAGPCGPHAAAGVWLPSVDRVGRHFPLLLV
jgi:type VI secretion system protein ImpM